MRRENFDARTRGLTPAIPAIDIIGCGTIGRPVARILAQAGAEKMTLWDDDTVSVENLASQGWRVADLGRAKVSALAEECEGLGAERPRAVQQRAGGDYPAIAPIALVCVDSVESRRRIAENVEAKYIIDGRIGGDGLQIVCRKRRDYAATIPAENATALCGQQSTAWIGSVCAGLMVAMLFRHLREEPTQDVYLNMRSLTLHWGLA